MTNAEPRAGLTSIISAMRNFADVADHCELTEGNAPASIRTWVDMLEALAHARPEAVDEYEAVGYAIKGGAEFYTEDYGTVSHKPPNGTILYVRTLTPERAP